MCRYEFLYNLYLPRSLCYLSVVTIRKELIRCLPEYIYHNLIRCKCCSTLFLTDVSLIIIQVLTTVIVLCDHVKVKVDHYFLHFSFKETIADTLLYCPRVQYVPF
jgi:hypothetical protein